MNRFFLTSFLFFAFSCTTLDSPQLSHIAVFNSPYHLVWKAALLALSNYPIEMEHQESGQIETKIIRGYAVWKPPKGSTDRLQSRSYKLRLLFERGSASSSSAQKSVRVHIMKEEFIDEDFIQKSIPANSNGLEEEVLLYRIGRELELMRKKTQFFNKKKSLKKLKQTQQDDEESDEF